MPCKMGHMDYPSLRSNTSNLSRTVVLNIVRTMIWDCGEKISRGPGMMTCMFTLQFTLAGTGCCAWYTGCMVHRVLCMVHPGRHRGHCAWVAQLGCACAIHPTARVNCAGVAEQLGHVCTVRPRMHSPATKLRMPSWDRDGAEPRLLPLLQGPVLVRPSGQDTMEQHWAAHQELRTSSLDYTF